jgi:hypothetical protein
VTRQGSEWIVRLAMRDHDSGYVRMIAPPEIVEPVPESELPVPEVPEDATTTAGQGAG